MSQNVHATAVALRLCGAWRGVLIRGASGSGKSDLALRLIAEGARLVADDRVDLWQSSGRLFASTPPRIAGLIEVRGLGIRSIPYLDLSAISLVVDLVSAPPERLPEPAFVTLQGVSLPLLQLYPAPASAPTLVRRAIETL